VETDTWSSARLPSAPRAAMTSTAI
jgi:hypothetical protein